MENKKRFTLLPFPQSFDGNNLLLNIVVLPRNQNPLISANGQVGTPAFADANWSFNAHLFHGLQGYPTHNNEDTISLINSVTPPNARSLFAALGSQLNINDGGQNNVNLDNNSDKVGDAKPKNRSVNKYLPRSYRSAFNFTTPRTKNAKTDDSYHCAVKGAKPNPAFQQSPNAISWGRVYAYAMRQPLLAEQLGMIYRVQIPIQAADFENGGWVYIDLEAGSDYRNELNAEPTFIKKYAARIPNLSAGVSRNIFAPILFPVLNPLDSLDGFDQLFLEAAEYDDGFAKIVHCFQPCDRNLLLEENTGAHPTKESGIRLGWDDEQILIWYMRQMTQEVDTPMGVFGYAVDVRNAEPANQAWSSLNMVDSKNILSINNITTNEPPIPIGEFNGELPYQVYPSQLDGDKTKSYWLPMHFANWLGKSMVIPDQDAADIYHTNDPTMLSDGGTGVNEAAKNQLNEMYDPGEITTVLQYGGQYDFRIRMQDLSGGGPSVSSNIENESPSQITRCRFKRYVAPNQPRIRQLREDLDDQNGIDSVPVNSDGFQSLNQLNIRRPLLGYPAVVFTGKYQLNDPVELLKTASFEMLGKEAFGIADPDVDRVKVVVEIQALTMDKLLSVDGKEDYVHFYTTYRNFPATNNENYEAELVLPIIYKDAKVIHTGDELDVEADLDLANDIDDIAEIVLPTARGIRLTIQSVCEDKDDNDEYYGTIDLSNHKRDSRYSPIVEVMLYQPSTNEEDLFVDATPAKMLQGIYLRPEAPVVFDGQLKTIFFGKTENKPPEAIQLLADQLEVKSNGLSLIGEKGERIQFGCSGRIRHTMAPDNSSITFASKGDLSNHWLCCLQLEIDRDWTWDGLEDRSFVITRTKRFTKDGESETSEVGTIQVKRIASFESLHQPKRNFTRLIFIDAVEPKTERKQPAPDQDQLRFPDTIEVNYTITTQFKPDHAAAQDEALALDITLPITTPPTQVPAIASAGIALSPYVRNEKYSQSEPRRKYLWIEFEEPIQDPKDTYFARVLKNAPDQLISNNHPELWVASNEPALPIAPEHIRVIPPDGTNDRAGLNAMQPMEKATDSDVHYLLPLPAGLHADADEMFGFFTYEFRVGHYQDPDTQDMVWTTAQGRFGRRLRSAGIQHPAPTMTAIANRDEEKLYVTAPYATAVFKGKNVTADPPRTQLWCLLYAQVKQADNQDYRNILLDNKQMDWRIRVEHDRTPHTPTTDFSEGRGTLARLVVKNLSTEVDYGKYMKVHKLTDLTNRSKDATKMGTAIWTNDEIARFLDLYCLLADASLSVLVVEFFGNINNIFDHISDLEARATHDSVKARMAGSANLPNEKEILYEKERITSLRDAVIQSHPLGKRLGHHRILRTSPLTEVPDICCEDC